MLRKNDNDELCDPSETINQPVDVRSDKIQDRLGAIREELTRSQAHSVPCCESSLALVECFDFCGAYYPASFIA
jgi:hypothetical protein